MSECFHNAQCHLTPELRHSRWRRARACNHSGVTEIKSENDWRGGCCLQRLVRPINRHNQIITRTNTGTLSDGTALARGRYPARTRLPANSPRLSASKPQLLLYSTGSQKPMPKYKLQGLTSKLSHPGPRRPVRECGTESAIPGWLQRLVRHHVLLDSLCAATPATFGQH